VNSLNVIRIAEREIEVVPHLLRPGFKDFTAVEAIVIPRHRAEGAPVG
jgi:hypothetical protein